VHSALVAEPANSASALASYVPLGLFGLAGPAKSVGGGCTRFAALHLSILTLGIGTAALHASLTSFAQKADRLSMLWYLATTAFCMISVCLRAAGSEAASSKWPAVLVAGSAAAATITCLVQMESFAIFYSMVTAYTSIAIFGLIWLSVNADFANHGVRGKVFRAQVFLPLILAVSWSFILAKWIWLLEMIGCESLTQRRVLGSTLMPMVWARWLHALWHFTTALAMLLYTQLLAATHGFQHHWGMPCIRWFGVPYVAMLPHVE